MGFAIEWLLHRQPLVIGIGIEMGRRCPDMGRLRGGLFIHAGLPMHVKK